MDIRESHSRLGASSRLGKPIYSQQRRVSWGGKKYSSSSLAYDGSILVETSSGHSKRSVFAGGDGGEISHWSPTDSRIPRKSSGVNLKRVISTSWQFFSFANCFCCGKKRPLNGVMKGREVKIDTSILPVDFISTYQGHIKPSSIALIALDGTTTYTYEELNNLSDLMAKNLKPRIEKELQSDACREMLQDLDSEPCVGIALPHSENWIIVILSIWKLGLAYFPIRVDENPCLRIAKTLDRIRPVVIIASEFDEDLERAIENRCTIVHFEPLWRQTTSQKSEFKNHTAWSAEEREKRLSIKALFAYRGNTEPSQRCSVVLQKFNSNGEAVTTYIRNITLWNRVHAEWKIFPYAHDECVGMYSSVDSHEFLGQIMTPLLAGAPLVVISVADLYTFAEQVTKWKLQRLKIYPSFLRAILTLLDIAEKGSPESKFFHTVKYWFCTGGSLRRDLATSFFRRTPKNTRLVNLYGCKEALAFVCLEQFKSLREVENGIYYETLPIGRPVINTRIYILDEDGKIMRNSGLGEVFIAGLGISTANPSSIHDDDAAANTSTSTKLLLPNKNLTAKDDPMYSCMLKTTDFGKVIRSEANKYKPFGCLLWDNATLKISGNGEGEAIVENYRINTNELIFHIKSMPTVKACHVMIYRPGTQSMAIVAFVVVAHRYTLTKEELHLHLRNRVPKYMMPTIVFLPGLPIKNFKINNSQLVEAYQREQTSSCNSLGKRTSINPEHLLGVTENPPETKEADILFRVLFHCCGVGEEWLAAHMDWSLSEVNIPTTALPRVLKELRKHGYFIDLKTFFKIKTPDDILQLMIANNAQRLQQIQEKSGDQFTVEVVTAKHKGEIIKFFARSNFGFDYKYSVFYICGMTKRLMKQAVVKIWPLLVQKAYSIVVRDKRSKKLVAALLSVDHADKLASEQWRALAKSYPDKYYTDMMDDIDKRMKINRLNTAKTLQTLFFLVDTKLDANFNDSLQVTKLLITKVLQVAKAAGFHAIYMAIFDYFYSNMVADELKFDIIGSKQINTFEAKDGNKPFVLAPDNIYETVLHKAL